MTNITKHTNYFRCCIEPHFYTLSFCSGWWNRTTDLLVMSQTSYHFSDPHQLWRWGESNPRLDSNAIKSFTSLVSFFPTNKVCILKLFYIQF